MDDAVTQTNSQRFGGALSRPLIVEMEHYGLQTDGDAHVRLKTDDRQGGA